MLCAIKIKKKMKTTILLLTLITPLIVCGQNTVEKILETANGYSKTGEYEKAIEKYSEAIEMSSDNPKLNMIYLNRGLSKSKMGDFKRAVKDLDKCIELKPDYDEAYLYRGTTYKLLYDTKKALKDYLMAAKINNKNFYAYLYIADIYLDQRKYKVAIENYTKSIKTNDNFVETYSKRAGTYYMLEKYEKAIEDYSKVIEMIPDESAQFYFMRGLSKSVLKDQDVKGACSDFRKAKELGYNLNYPGLNKYCNTDDLE